MRMESEQCRKVIGERERQRGEKTKHREDKEGAKALAEMKSQTEGSEEKLGR